MLAAIRDGTYVPEQETKAEPEFVELWVDKPNRALGEGWDEISKVCRAGRVYSFRLAALRDVHGNDCIACKGCDKHQDLA